MPKLNGFLFLDPAFPEYVKRMYTEANAIPGRCFFVNGIIRIKHGHKVLVTMKKISKLL
jgi:hypothetical protein